MIGQLHHPQPQDGLQIIVSSEAEKVLLEENKTIHLKYETLLKNYHIQLGTLNNEINRLININYNSSIQHKVI